MSRVTVLVNDEMPEGLEAEHGFAALIEHRGFRLLFDTGASGAVIRNAVRLGIDLARIDAVLLSHGHCDHTGGLDAVLDRNATARVFLHANAMIPRYSRHPGKPPHTNGMPSSAARRLFAQETRITWTPGPTRVAEGLLATGEIPRRNDFEDTGGAFFLDPEGTKPDALLDDQSVAIETAAGLVLVTGCAHSGIVNTLDRVADLSGGKRIHAVIGGLHLGRADERRLDATVAAIERHGVSCLLPLHCTGARAVERLAGKLREKVLGLSGGVVVSFT